MVAIPIAEAAKKTSKHPAVRQMEKVANELINAQRTGTIASFSNVIRRHADVPDIANFSLGRYRSKLPKSKRSAYYRGVQRFMARYFARNTKRYRVVKATINPTVTESGEDVFVDTKVELQSGATYNVRWRLAKRRGVYKITDVKILVFSLVTQQRALFYKFLSKRDGNVNKLVLALNR
ncbi:MAG: ABC transporter substrate-binding protein [Rhizobiales bacterium]|nr:ABC transporter substrate-binding protein [Hyphomicrobiales bacterium]